MLPPRPLPHRQYDTNDDGFISPEEFRRLCAESALDLSAAEVAAAFDLLDTGGWVGPAAAPPFAVFPAWGR